ncbi:MAG: hypothetical protein NTW21_25575 [Verrucomicrobia bacterium]|nr:hypothetical protein [Verrucomicrobiota bacterium]
MKIKILKSVFTMLTMMVAPAGATIVSISVSGPTGCDLLLIPSAPVADELGFSNTFPGGERISFRSEDTTLSACSTTDNPLIMNKLVSVTNLQTITISDLYYVVNGGPSPGTFSNFDGFVNGSMTMKIDAIGDNKPLWSESIATDGYFQPGETWQFIVQDYVSTVPVDAFYSPQTVGGTDTLPSLIVPEPTGAALGLLGGLLLLRRRR